MLRLMFMPWYTYPLDVYNTPHYTIKPTNLIAQPFIYNNVIYDYDEPKNVSSYIEYNYTNKVTDYGVTINNNNYPFLMNGRSALILKGFPCLVFSKIERNYKFFKSQSITSINGKYKFNNKNTAFSNDDLKQGITIPIKININGNSLKYLVISSSNSWFREDTTSKKYIGGYNIPYNLNNNTPPTDMIMVEILPGTTINLDFGNSPQEIPQFVYDWFIQQFDKEYENTYTIKSVTGSTLTTLTEAPPMISATLSAVGNAKYLTLKGENNTNYTMEWTSETPQGKIFVGLATSKGGSIVIPVGETSTINLTDSTDLYEVWQTYRPPTTTFEIKTYNYSGETSRVDKTDYLTPISTLSGVLRGESSLLNFNVLIQSDTVPNFNYCYIDKFKRYYYVTEPVSVRQNLWEMTMQVDALMTYKDSLLKCEGYIDRNEYIQNKMIIDNNRAIMQGADFEEDTITNELFGSGSFVLSGLRIGTKEK